MHTELCRWGERLIANCRVCGKPAFNHHDRADTPGTWRCRKHAKSNPCAIEGCSRSRKADGILHDGRYWVCATHWRIVCPPRSAERREYLRFFRIAKRIGLDQNDRWPEPLERRFWRYFAGLVRRGRQRCSGDMDMTEINRMFGWDAH